MVWSDLNRRYHCKLFEDCLPQFLPCLFLDTLHHLMFTFGTIQDHLFVLTFKLIIYFCHTITVTYCRYTISITAQKMKFSANDFFSKCEQIHSFLRIITFTKDTFYGNLRFLCDVSDQGSSPNFPSDIKRY